MPMVIYRQSNSPLFWAGVKLLNREETTIPGGIIL